MEKIDRLRQGIIAKHIVYRQTDRQTDKQTNKQTNKQIHTNIHEHKQQAR